MMVYFFYVTNDMACAYCSFFSLYLLFLFLVAKIVVRFAFVIGGVLVFGDFLNR